MTFDQLLSHYGTQAEIARAYGVSRASVNRWAKTGVVPELRILQFERSQNPPERWQVRRGLQVEAARRWAEKG